MDVQLEIPDDIALALNREASDLSRTALESLALEGYRTGRLSEGQIRRMLGFSTRMQVHAFLKEHHVYLNYSVDALNQDLQALALFEQTLRA